MMGNEANLLVPLPSVVEKVGTPVTPRDVDIYGRVQEIKDQSHRVRTIVKAWKDQQAEERAMRRSYATALLIGLGVQALLMNVIYILMGCGVLTFEPWTARTFIMAVFAEIAAMVFWIVKYLFHHSGDEILKLEARTSGERAKGTTRERPKAASEH